MLGKDPRLYASFTRGPTLPSTFPSDPKIEEQITDLTRPTTAKAPRADTQRMTSESTLDSPTNTEAQLKSSKKRKRADDGNKKHKKHKGETIENTVVPNGIGVDKIEAKEDKKKKKHKLDVPGNEDASPGPGGNDRVQKSLGEDQDAPTKGLTDGEKEERQRDTEGGIELQGHGMNGRSNSERQDIGPSNNGPLTSSENDVNGYRSKKERPRENAFSDMSPGFQYWRTTSTKTKGGSSNMNPERLAMINNTQQQQERPSHPVPSGPLILGTYRREYVIKDFYPFCVGSEWSRRRAIRKGRPIRRSPRSIRKEARDLMQQQMIREAKQRGEPIPVFEKPKTKREMREEKKARKKDPKVRVLKFERRRLQRSAQRERNAEVKALREEGKHDEADVLERKPLFEQVTVGETKKRKHSEEEDDSEEDESGNSSGGVPIDDEDDDDSPSSVSSSSGSSTDDLEDFEDLPSDEEAKLTPEERDERKARQRKKRKEKEAKASKKPKTKREKREERFRKMPEVAPPILPVPKFDTVMKGIPLPYTKRRGSLKELKTILAECGLTQEEQTAYIHKALVDRQEAINIKQSRRAAMRRERAKKRGAKKHAKHIRCQQEMAVNRRKKEERRGNGEFVETSSEKKARKRRDKEEKERAKEQQRFERMQKRHEREAAEAAERGEKYKNAGEGDDFIPI